MNALISVFDKTNIVDFAKDLASLNINIYSTGGTYDLLKKNNIGVYEVSKLTNFPECLDGRVKTLHPNIHAGILAKRNNKEHISTIKELNIETIDIVVCNLYPFKKTVETTNDFEKIIENIDIGGPTMLRAGAKNFENVTTIVDVNDYEKVISELKKNGKTSYELRKELMKKVFNHTAQYDCLIAEYMNGDDNEKFTFSDSKTYSYDLFDKMRYGENPHQNSGVYKQSFMSKDLISVINAKQLHGKELSYNNYNDANNALGLLLEFTEPTVVATKHGNPCGVGSADDIYKAWQKAFTADKVSIFGGVVVANRQIDENIATEMNEIFLEIVIAPSFSDNALKILKQKKNIRILELPQIISENRLIQKVEQKNISGGMLIQDVDNIILDKELKTVTKTKPTEKEIEDLLFAFKVVKWTKSNAIVSAKDKQTIGIGPGQVNRIWALKQAVEHSKELISADVAKNSVLASDAFFPFDDCVEVAHKAGIKSIIQPGGSIKDADSIKKCNEYGISMVFTGIRHFKH